MFAVERWPSVATPNTTNEGNRGHRALRLRLLPDGALEPDEHEQETIRIARDLSAEGLSLRKIGARLLALGRTPKASTRGHPRTVQSLLRAREVA